MEERIQAALDTREVNAATTLTLRGYGPEVLGWLVTSTGDSTVAEEVFAQASESLWASLSTSGSPGTFRRDCSMRTWIYLLARNALVALRRTPRARRETLRSEISEVVEEVRSRTQPWLRTEIKDRFRTLRDALDEESRQLLILRVDRQMAWSDIAKVLGEPGEPDQASARVRKRFSLMKEKLRAHAEQEGLLDSAR